MLSKELPLKPTQMSPDFAFFNFKITQINFRHNHVNSTKITILAPQTTN
jgi:hypothetical protein